MCDWLIAASGGKPEHIHVAIEVPHGAVVETLLDRGFKVYAINPRQLDRFRDRFSPAGAKEPGRRARGTDERNVFRHRYATFGCNRLMLKSAERLRTCAKS